MFFGFTGSQKQSRASLREALAEVNRAKPEDQLVVADALATLADNARNGPLATEILNATKHLRPSVVDQRVVDALLTCSSSTMVTHSLERMTLRCIAESDTAGLAMVVKAQLKMDAAQTARRAEAKAVADAKLEVARLARAVAELKLRRSAERRLAQSFALR